MSLDPSTSEALSMRAWSITRGQKGRSQLISKSRGHKKGKCSNYGKLGNLRRGDLHQNNEKNDENPYRQLAKYSTIDFKETTTCENLCLNNNISLLYDWVLDSGASFHMSPHID